MSQQVVDPWQAALEATEPPQIMFGEILLDLFFCALVKGEGRVLFDPTKHAPGQRRTCVKVGVYPLQETGLTFAVEREFIAEIANDGWLKVTLPSLRDLAVTDLKAVNGKYAQVELVKYGSYQKDGETKEKTAPKVLVLYPDQATCLAAYDETVRDRAVANGTPIDELNEQLFGATPTAAKSNGSTNGTNDQERNTALAFLPAIIRTCRHDGNENKGIDITKLEQQIKSNSLLSKHFTIDSTEVTEAVNQVLKEGAF